MATTGGFDASATQYDVFLSFRGPDTRKTFTDFLYRTMVGQGIVAYRDNEELRPGEWIDDLLEAVGNSKICIPVLSRGYASSAWCLRELACAMELNESTGKPEILPIFFDVTPTDVKLRTPLYLKDLKEHEQSYGSEIRQRWEAALGKVAEIKGWEVQGKGYGELIEHCLKQIMLKLRDNRRPLDSKLLSWEKGQPYGVDVRSVRRRITSWKKGKLLGKGSFGEVYQALTNDGFSFAVKEVSMVHEVCKQSLLYLEQEISLLSQFRHDNIVQYYGTEKDDEKLYLFLELMTEGSLVMLYKKRILSESEVSTYVRQILNGLKYLHDQNFAHRDIKCANILVNASGSVKLADFGSAKAIKMNGVNSVIGSSHWMAPEVFDQKDTGYGLAADIWSLGCTLLELFTGQPPYSPLNEWQALYKILIRELPPFPNYLSRDAQDFIRRCLQVNPDDRPSAAELLDHPFVRNASSSFASPHFNNVQL